MSEDQVAEAPAVNAGQATSEAVTTEFNFRDHIDETLRDDPSLSTYKDLNGMAKSLINAQKMIGADKIAIPGSWATDEDWSQVYDKLGRPGASDGYNIETNEVMTENDVGWFQDVAHKVGLNTNQAQALFGEYTDLVSNIREQSTTDLTNLSNERESELRREWGNNFEARIEGANNVVAEFSSEDAGILDIQLSDGSLLGDHPAFVRMTSGIAEFMASKLGEDTFSGRDNEPGMSSADIQLEMSKLTQQGSPYWIKDHPDHDNAVAEVMRLRRLIHD